MKKVLISVFLILAASVSSNLFAQTPAGGGTPAGAGDRNLAGDDIKTRSIEMERMKQESERTEAALFAPINKDISAKFPQIKEDFEGVQMLDSAIIKAYSTGKAIDYKSISVFADEISKKSKRLDANLFAAPGENKDGKSEAGKSNDKPEKVKSVRDLIVDLDSAIGDFVSSKIFANIKVIEPAVAIKTRTDLLKVIDLSEKLTISAKEEK